MKWIKNVYGLFCKGLKEEHRGSRSTVLTRHCSLGVDSWMRARYCECSLSYGFPAWHLCST